MDNMIQKNDLISVLIPAYKAGDLLDRCMRSIVNQSYKNLEIIIVAQPSPDDTVKNAHSWQDKDSRIRVVDQEVPDLSTARNNLLKHAQASMVCFVDNDDILNMDHILALYSIMIKNNVDIVQGKTYPFKEEAFLNKREITTEDLKKIRMIPGRKYTKGILNNSFGSDGIVTYTKLFKKKLFDGITYPEGRVVDDSSTTYKVAWNAEKVACFNVPTYYYQSERYDSITHNPEFSSKVFLHDMMAHIEQVYFFEKRDKEIYDLALYNLCQDFSKLEESKIQVYDQMTISEFEKYNEYFSIGIKSSVSLMKKINLIIGYYFPHLASKLRRLKYNINYKIQWKGKG